MNQEIKYNGFSAVPSDYECTDGALAVSINLLPEDGALHPLLSPAAVLHLGDGQSAVYIHKNVGYANYIIAYESGGAVHYALYKDGESTLADILELASGEKQTDIKSIGNTLVISTSLHLHYLLYKKDEGYIYLGTELPKPKMLFSLGSTLDTKQHKAALTFTDYQSAEGSFTTEATAYVSADLTAAVPAQGPASPMTAKDVSVNFAKNLEADTEYKFSASGTGFTKIYIYGATDSSSSYDTLCEVYNGSSAKCKTTKKYSLFKCFISWDAGATSHHADVTLTLAKGFSNAVTGKVIEYNSTNYEALFAAVNSFVATYGTNKDKFVFPFFVRYALRLVDGSHARISEPVLMIPNSGYAPFISFTSDSQYIDLYAFFAELQYAFLNSIDTKWSDIVAGVDVFVSQQIYPYNQGDAFDANINRLEYAFINKDINQVEKTSFGFCDLPNISSRFSYGYQKLDLYSVANTILGFGDTAKQTQWNIVRIAPAEDTKDKLLSIANFYLVHSFTLEECIPSTDELAYENTALPIKEGTLSGLVARQTLSDNSLSNCTFYNAHLVNYNSRLHLFDYMMRHPQPSSPTMQNGYVYRYDSYGTLQSVYVYIRTSQGERIVKSDITDFTEYGENAPWFFYPHNKAYKALLIYAKEGNYRTVTLQLKQHDYLNGAYWMPDNGLNGNFTFSDEQADISLPTVNDTSQYPSCVLQSQVSLPFMFLDSMLNELPVSLIFGMSSAAKALSQGQFGQFPLYAFTTEGVWALEVSSTGTYSARQPITRDVCINSAGITQLDSAVLFPTDRGIMLISGSQTLCISDAVNSEYPFDATQLPGFTKLHAMLGHEPADDKCLPTLPFTQFLKQCRMIYDYVHQRVIVYAPGITYAYVYSLKSQQWGMTFSNVASHLNSYPEALAVDNANNILNFSVPKTDEPVKCLYTTRPLKLEAANVLKTIDNVIQRGLFRKGNVATVLYGSRDLVNWHLVWSSKDHYLRGFRGTPYKYFRIAGVATLCADENIFGASVQFTPRQQNQPR